MPTQRRVGREGDRSLAVGAVVPQRVWKQPVRGPIDARQRLDHRPVLGSGREKQDSDASSRFGLLLRSRRLPVPHRFALARGGPPPRTIHRTADRQVSRRYRPKSEYKPRELLGVAALRCRSHGHSLCRLIDAPKALHRRDCRGLSQSPAASPSPAFLHTIGWGCHAAVPLSFRPSGGRPLATASWSASNPHGHAPSCAGGSAAARHRNAAALQARRQRRLVVILDGAGRRGVTQARRQRDSSASALKV